MKKMILALVLVLVMSVPALALGGGGGDDNSIHNTATATATGGSATATGGSASATGGAGGSASIVDNSRTTNNNTNLNTNLNTNHNTNTLTNHNSNIQGQNQGQGQGQMQGQGQGQGQSQFGYVNIETPQGFVATPSQSIPELGFGHGRLEWNYAQALPKVTITRYNFNEIVTKEVDTRANIKAKNLLPVLLNMVKKQMPICTNDRLIIIKAEEQKSWNTGGNVGGAGSYLPTSGLAGASGAGSIVPNWGGTKADDLYTIIIVRVAW